MAPNEDDSGAFPISSDTQESRATGYVPGSVASKDGTVIGFRQFGIGPGLILVHGAMQAAQNFSRLAMLLSDTFTVFVPDRRGRGASGPHGAEYGMQKEVDDLAALVEATGTSNVFGLSSGALITLRTALAVPSIRKVALYEPPLILPGQPSPAHWAGRYQQEVAKGNLAAAMVEVLKATGDPSLFLTLPRFILVPLIKLAIKANHRDLRPDSVPLEALIPTVQYDAQLPDQTNISTDDLRALKAEVLLLGGTGSQPFLKAALDYLAGDLPDAKRVLFQGAGHIAADNSGVPDKVADALRPFFRET